MGLKRVMLIHNPGAGDDRQPTASQLKALVKEAGFNVSYLSTKEKDWEKAIQRDVDMVAVAGGDGTVSKVAKRLIESNVPIGVLPMGTANNIAKTLGIQDLSITQLIPSWKSARRLKFDAGIARGPWGKQYFIEGAGLGLLTSAMPKVSKNKTLATLEDTEVKVSYAQQLFREHLLDAPAIEIEAMLDGKDISGSYLLLEVLNIQYIGPNLLLAPNLARNSGEFEVVLISAKHRKKLHSHIKHWQDGKRVPPRFDTHRGRCLTMQWSGYDLHFDDRIWPLKEKKKLQAPAAIELKVVPNASRFLVPATIHDLQNLARENTGKKFKKHGV